MSKRRKVADSFGDTRPVAPEDREMVAARTPQVPPARQTERSKMTYSQMSREFFPDPKRTK